MKEVTKQHILNDKVCLVIPFHNEAKNVQPLIREWSELLHFHKIKFQILAINAGSTDDTRGVLRSLDNEKLTVIDVQDKGHSKALIRGFKDALKTNSGWIFHTDSDGQIRALDFLKFWNERNSYQTQIGYRAQRIDGPLRGFLTSALSKIVSTLFGTVIKDINISYRLYERDHLSILLEEIPSLTNHPNVFLSLLAAKTSDGIRQIPVVHRRRKFGKSSMNHFDLIFEFSRLVVELSTYRPIYNFKINEIKKLITKSKEKSAISR